MRNYDLWLESGPVDALTEADMEMDRDECEYCHLIKCQCDAIYERSREDE